MAGVEAEYHGSSFAKLAFVVLRPDTFFLIVAAALKGHLLFWLNAMVYLVSMLLRGWMGGVFLLGVLLLCRHFPVNITYSRFFALVLCFVTVVAYLLDQGPAGCLEPLAGYRCNSRSSSSAGTLKYQRIMLESYEKIAACRPDVLRDMFSLSVLYFLLSVKCRDGLAAKWLRLAFRSFNVQDVAGLPWYFKRALSFRTNILSRARLLMS